MISEAQEQEIFKRVNEAEIKNALLKDDLIDHIYCLTEIFISKGEPFDSALDKAMDQMGTEGLKGIENQTIFLLNKSKIMLMKRSVFLSAYLFTTTWLVGVLLKAIHLPGAAVIMALGVIGLIFIALPLYFIHKYKALAEELISEKLKWFFGLVSVGFVVVSITMKLLHMPGSGLLSMISVSIFILATMPFIFLKMYKHSLEEV